MKTSAHLIQEKIYQASSKLLLSLTVEDTYAAIVDEALKLTHGEYGSIFLPVNGELERVYATDQRLYSIPIRKRGKTYTSYKKNQAYILTSTQLETIHPEFEKLSPGNDISVPLTYDKTTIGVLSVISKDNHQFSEDDLETLLYFSPIATLAINNVLAYQEIQRTLEERDLFISMASHELKTPLTTTMIYSQLLEKQLAQKKMTTEVTYTKNVISSLRRLQALVNELLQISQIKTGELKFQKKNIDLTQILSHMIKEAQDKYVNHSIVFVPSQPKKKAMVECDQSKIEQVIANLIHNATKYSAQKSVIRISLKEKNDGYSIEVSDKGKGIPKKELPHIFERFYRGDGSQASGLGLGLFIVKTIIDKHHGKIKVSSKINKGTTFSILLKKSKPSSMHS